MIEELRLVLELSESTGSIVWWWLAALFFEDLAIMTVLLYGISRFYKFIVRDSERY